MKITKVLEKGNCGSASDRGKEACIKAVSPRTETAYKAGSPGEVAQHTQAQSLGGKVNAGIVQQEFTFLSGEIPGNREVSKRHSTAKPLAGRPEPVGCVSTVEPQQSAVTPIRLLFEKIGMRPHSFKNQLFSDCLIYQHPI